MKQIILSVIFFFSSAVNIFSAVYYVSETGSDSNNGTDESTPWQSISKINSMMSQILPGDQILFKRGDRFYGTINISKSGTAGNEIVFGSYGTGNLPVITGKKLITGWTVHSGNIYRANFSDSVTHVYVDNKLMTIARYPNSGFLKVDVGNGITGFYDAELNQLSGYWNGANCRLRTANWSYETRQVSSFSGGNIVFSSPTQFTAKINYGYYLDNKLVLLDEQNEWFKDYSDGSVYLYAPGGVNPDLINVEAVVLKYGILITSGKHFLKFENLHVNGFADMGIYGYSSNNVIVTGCMITQTTSNGIRLNGANETITNNYLEDNLSNAIYIIGSGLIKNNNLNRTGIVPGYGTSGRGYLGMNIHIATGLTVENNIIDSTGYSALSVGKNMIIRNNYITYSMLVLNDGAGIDVAADADSMKILDNIILNSVGSTESSGNPAPYGNGIYVNGAVIKNSLIQNNTCAYNTNGGIYFDHKNTPLNNIITGNTLFNNNKAQMIFADYSAAVFIPVYNTVVKNNILYGLSDFQYGLEVRGHTSSGISDFGQFDSNYYCNPYTDLLISRSRYLTPYSTTSYTLADWKMNFNEDPNTKSIPYTFNQYEITDTLGNNLLSNSGFNTSISPWAGWPSGVTLGWTSHQLLDSGCLRMRWNGFGNSIGMTLSNRFPVSPGDDYLINISITGNHSGLFSLWGLSSLSSTTFTFPQKFFSYDTYRKDHSFVFKSNISDPEAYLGIALALPDSLIYVDNVSMYKVTIESIDSSVISKLFVNENNFVENISLDGINYKDLDGNSVTGSITLQPYSSKILINDNYIPSKDLQLTALIDGLYNPSINQMVSDSARVFMRGASSPFAIVDSCIAVLDNNGNGIFEFKNVGNSENYYLIVKHRNSIETWSKDPVSFISDNLTYDFTVSANKAFGNNLKEVGSKFCIYSGDVVNDGEIEMEDVLQTFNAVINFTSGYVMEDVTGDQNVDLDDLGIVYNNSLNFISVIRP